MTASKGAQLAVIAAGAVLLVGAVLVFGIPSTRVGTDLDGQDTSTSTSTPAAVDQPAMPERSAAMSSSRLPVEQPSAPASPEQVEAAPPAFDVVRVGPSGDSVIAGRAAPGKTLELLVNGQVHDKVEVANSGAFALTPPTLQAGDHQLTLREVDKDGGSTLSRQSVTVVLSPDRASPPVVALTEPDKPTALLSSGGVVARQLNGEREADVLAATPADGPDAATLAAGKAVQKVAIESVEAEAGRIYTSGHAPAGSAVRLYLNDSFMAEGKASDSGALSFRIDSGVPPGDYRVRLDEVAPEDGKVRSRAEVAFSMPATPADGTQPETARRDGVSDDAQIVVPEIHTVRVEHGDSLWAISRRIYGEGLRYTVIYDANQTQIRNPDRIYPGQVFVLPLQDASAAR
ncbi:LysM peptidoglycan-binding domain-containing protein [Pseudochelatococcus contaminans]|uniref:Nucleoid-associated protein YgaU n=1 Tax=Pseudochelatococcus contaminans TaxID=1538103 RepID=A0A7W5Z1F9_9HYPH|nr:LysM peptidoglycan-binding domain-containing protein [Pseudochelatococcus contaminans]MBB3808243.1 nucleoid-associated protein YgaU [Pseudochelatococcus contaminans]